MILPLLYKRLQKICAFFLIAGIITTHPVSARTWASYKVNLATASRFLLLPTTVLHNCLLGSQPAEMPYQDRLNEFLSYVKKKNVPIKKIEMMPFMRSLLRDQDHFKVFADGIWLCEDKLTGISEAEVIFTLACAATGYALLHPKDTLIDGMLYTAPTIWTLISNAIVVSMATPLDDFGFNRRTCYSFLKNGGVALVAGAITLGGYQIHQSFKHLIDKKQTKSSYAMICETVKLLYSHGYGWAVDDYLNLLKTRIDQKMPGQLNQIIDDSHLYALLEKLTQTHA
jgi:hypothetical protein